MLCWRFLTTAFPSHVYFRGVVEGICKLCSLSFFSVGRWINWPPSFLLVSFLGAGWRDWHTLFLCCFQRCCWRGSKHFLSDVYCLGVGDGICNTVFSDFSFMRVVEGTGNICFCLCLFSRSLFKGLASFHYVCCLCVFAFCKVLLEGLVNFLSDARVWGVVEGIGKLCFLYLFMRVVAGTGKRCFCLCLF